MKLLTGDLCISESVSGGHFQVPRTYQKTLETCNLVPVSYPDSLQISSPMGCLLFHANGTEVTAMESLDPCPGGQNLRM